MNDRNSLFRSSRSKLNFSAHLPAQAPLRLSQRPPNRLDPAFRLFRADTVSDNLRLCQLRPGPKISLDIRPQLG